MVNSTTGDPAGLWERVYFAGFSLTTLGVGDYRAQGTAWQLLTVLAAASGFSAFTLSVTYLLPIVSAGVQKRQLALNVSGLGKTPQQILARAWHDEGFETLTPHATSLASLLTTFAEQHLVYPVLHYFHSKDLDKAGTLAVAKLDEVLTILEHGVKLENPLDPLTFHSLRGAITTYLDNLQTSYIDPADEVPPAPSLAERRTMRMVTVGSSARTSSSLRSNLRRGGLWAPLIGVRLSRLCAMNSSIAPSQDGCRD